MLVAGHAVTHHCVLSLPRRRFELSDEQELFRDSYLRRRTCGKINLEKCAELYPGSEAVVVTDLNLKLLLSELRIAEV